MLMKEYDFFFFLNLFLARWKRIVLCAFVFMAAAFVICKYCVKPVYSSSVTIFCGRILSDISPQDTTQRQFISEYSGSLNIGLQLVNDCQGLLKSDRIKDKVLEVVKPYVPSPKFYSNVIVSAVRQTRIISIEVQTHDAKLCQIMANAYAGAFIGEIQNIMHMQNSQIIDQAKLPEEPIRPRIAVVSPAAFFIGGLLAYLVFFAMTLLDSTIKNPDEATSLLDLPMIGTIPQDDELTDEKYTGDLVLSTAGGSKSTALSEHFRAARVNLQYSIVSKKTHGLVYIITSSIPAEGKSFNSSNLAASMAESGKKVLLINCDLRKPTLQKIFKTHADSGLVNCLIGEKSFEEVVHRNVMDLPLDVIFCGPIPPNPARLLVSEEFGKLVEEQRKNYDCIFLDTPPVLSTADAVMIGKYADAVVMVVRCGYTHSKLVQQSIDEIKRAKLNLVGMILNRYQDSVTKRGYGYGYGYGWGAYYDDYWGATYGGGTALGYRSPLNGSTTRGGRGISTGSLGQGGSGVTLGGTTRRGGVDLQRGTAGRASTGRGITSGRLTYGKPAAVTNSRGLGSGRSTTTRTRNGYAPSNGRGGVSGRGTYGDGNRGTFRGSSRGIYSGDRGNTSPSRGTSRSSSSSRGTYNSGTSRSSSSSRGAYNSGSSRSSSSSRGTYNSGSSRSSSSSRGTYNSGSRSFSSSRSTYSSGSSRGNMGGGRSRR